MKTTNRVDGTLFRHFIENAANQDSIYVVIPPSIATVVFVLVVLNTVLHIIQLTAFFVYVYHNGRNPRAGRGRRGNRVRRDRRDPQPQGLQLDAIRSNSGGGTPRYTTAGDPYSTFDTRSSRGSGNGRELSRRSAQNGQMEPEWPRPPTPIYANTNLGGHNGRGAAVV